MVFKNPKTDKWEVRCYYKNYKGERKQKTKRDEEKNRRERWQELSICVRRPSGI